MSVPSTFPTDLSPLRAERRKSIVAAASKLFAQLGYAECDMERVAKKLRIAKGTLYLYFKSKEALFFACVDHGMRQMQAEVQAASNSETDPFRRISTAVWTYLKYFQEHPEHAELIIQERAGFKKRKRPTYFDYRESGRGPWRELYKTLVQEGRLRDDIPVERMLETFGNLTYGTMFSNHFVGPSVALEEQHAALIKVIFEGLLSDRERKASGRSATRKAAP